MKHTVRTVNALFKEARTTGRNVYFKTIRVTGLSAGPIRIIDVRRARTQSIGIACHVKALGSGLWFSVSAEDGDSVYIN